MRLSVIIPVFNEMDTIETVLQRVRAVPLEKEIIIVDDGSSDGTREWLTRFHAPDVQVILHASNRGKGAAIRTGLQHITGDVVIIQDADLELDPMEYLKLLEPIQKGETRVVFGSRFLQPPSETIWMTYMANRVLTWLTNWLYGCRLTDMMTCYKMFTRDIAKSLTIESNRFEVEPEITARILGSGHRIVEVPVQYRPRRYRQGKKIRWSDFFRVVRALWKYRKYAVLQGKVTIEVPDKG